MATRLEEQAKRGQWADPALGRISLSEWSVQRLAGLNVTAKTRSLYEERLRTLIPPRFGTVRLCDITRSAVNAWLSTLEGPPWPGQRRAETGRRGPARPDA